MSRNEDFREAEEHSINAEWSATSSALNSSDTTSSNSYVNIETLNECCRNSSDTLKDKEDFMVFESSSTVVDISKFNVNDTKYDSERKTTAFQKKYKPFSQNVSSYFENVLDNDSQIEITQNSICLNRFQNRKRLIPPNDENCIEIDNSNFSGSNSADVSMMKFPKFCFSRKKNYQIEISDYNLSCSNNGSISKNVSKIEVLTKKFNLNTIDVADSVFENIINNSSMTSEITLNNKRVSFIETSVSNVNTSPVFSTISNLNSTYDVHKNNNTMLLDAIVEHDKSISETPVLLQNNRSKSFNLLPLKFNFSNKFGRHSMNLQENRPSFDGVKKHNISLNTDFIKNTGEQSTNFHKSAYNSNVNLKLHPHISVIQVNNSSPGIQLLDDSLPTNILNHEQLQPNLSISSTSTNEGLSIFNSTPELLGSCCSSRTQSRLLTSKQSKCSTLNNYPLNSTIESLDSTFNTTTGLLKQNVLSINRSTSKHSSSVINEKTSINSLILDNVINNVMTTTLSKQKSNHLGNVEPVTYDDNEQIMPNTLDGSLIETRVLKSSLRINKNKSLLTKSLTTENNINHLSIGSTRTLKNIVHFDNKSDNSLFWTTLPDESTNISNIQNISIDACQTPKKNKLSIAENKVNTIKIISTNNKKSTHPGSFEIDDHNDRPSRSFVTRSCNHSPSILTLVFGGKKTSESRSSLTQSPPEILFDQSQVEENLNQKFQSLYKKEPWITKRLYKFLIIKLQPNYNIYSVKYAEKFVKYLTQVFKQIYNDQINLQLSTDMLRYHMARYHIIKDTFDYLEFLTDYIPMAYYKKLVPGWNIETSAVKFDPQKYYIPLMDDEEFLSYIMEHLNEA